MFNEVYSSSPYSSASSLQVTEVLPMIIVEKHGDTDAPKNQVYTAPSLIFCFLMVLEAKCSL